MADTTFSNGTVVTADWLNDVNDHVYPNHKYVYYVEDYGAVGDGVTDDSAAFQAAIDAAEATIANSPSLNGVSAEIRLQNGPYLIDSSVTVTKHRIGFIGNEGGSTVQADNLIFIVGDYTDTIRCRYVSFENIIFKCTDGANTTAGLRLYRTTQAQIHKCRFVGWDRHIDLYRASGTHITLCNFSATGRTTNASAAIRFQGTDERATTGETYTPGGGCHITDCEFAGETLTTVTDSGILVHSVDGLYITQCHWTGYKYTIDIEAKATPENRVITDIYFTGCYFDEPLALTGSPRNVYIHGTVKESITHSDSSTDSSQLRLFRFVNNYFRGGNKEEADRGFYVDVDDGDTWWNNAKEDDLGPITLVANHFRKHNISAIQILGAGSSKVEATGVNISDNVFEDCGISNPSGIGICINVQAEDVTVADNKFLKNLGTSDYIVNITARKDGNDNTRPSAVVTGNDFSKATGYSVRPINITRSEVGSNIVEADNLFPGTGRHINQCYKVTTTNATPTTVWSYVIPENTAVYGEVVVTGSDSTGARYVVYSWTFDGRRATSGTLAENITAGRVVKDGTTPAPTFTRSSNTLTLEVTGVAATTIDWNAHVTATFAR